MASIDTPTTTRTPAQWAALVFGAEPDNYLHLGTGILALYFGTLGATMDRR